MLYEYGAVIREANIKGKVPYIRYANIITHNTVGIVSFIIAFVIAQYDYLKTMF